MEFVDKTIEVDCDIREVYDAWTQFEDFPKFMTAVERIDVAPDESMHWVAYVEDQLVEWDAGLAEEITDQSVEWRAYDGSETDRITFDKVGDDVTQIHYQVAYEPDLLRQRSGGDGDSVEQRVEDDLRSFKQYMESQVH